MVFVHDYPVPADLAQTDGQPKLQLGSLSVRLRSSTAHQGSDKRHFLARGNVHLADIKDSGILKPGKEPIPSLLVRFDSF